MPRVKRDLLMDEASLSIPFSALVSFTRSLPACILAHHCVPACIMQCLGARLALCSAQHCGW